MSVPSDPGSRGGSNGGGQTASGVFQAAVLEKLEAIQTNVNNVKADLEKAKSEVKAEIGAVKKDVDVLIASDKKQDVRIAKQGKLISKANAIKGTLAAVGGGVVIGLYELAQKLIH